MPIQKDIKVFLGLCNNKCVATLDHKGDTFVLPPFKYKEKDSYVVCLKTIYEIIKILGNNNFKSFDICFYGVDFDVLYEYKNIFLNLKQESGEIKNAFLWSEIEKEIKKYNFNLKMIGDESPLAVVGKFYG